MLDPVYFDLRQSDLDNIVNRVPKIWDDLRGTRLFITGGTGFFGRWILGSLLWANKILDTEIEIVVMSRDPKRFLAKFPEVKTQYLEFFKGDIRSAEYPDSEFETIIHMATDSSFSQPEEHLQLLDGILFGTRSLLDYAVNRAQTKKLLFVSSGAVYGSTVNSPSMIHENYQSAPSPSNRRSLIGNAKRSAEQMCTLFHEQFNLDVKIARCFSFVGPHLPMTGYFAIGNFIHDALFEESIQIKGDGTPTRSYLYASDLAAWLLTILAAGRPNYPYNVGSDVPITMKNLAELTGKIVAPEKSIRTAGHRQQSPDLKYYVPSVIRAREELRVEVWTSLGKAIASTADWYSKGRHQ